MNKSIWKLMTAHAIKYSLQFGTWKFTHKGGWNNLLIQEWLNVVSNSDVWRFDPLYLKS